MKTYHYFWQLIRFRPRTYAADLTGATVHFGLLAVQGIILKAFFDGLTGEGGLPLLQVEGTASAQGGGSRQNGVQVLGVDDEFWRLGESGEAPALTAGAGDWFAINDVLARRLGVGVGYRIILRVEIPGALSKDAPLSCESDRVLPLTLEVGEIIAAGQMGR